MFKVFLLSFLVTISGLSQTAMDKLSNEEEILSPSGTLIVEKIEKISGSKRIFILSNQNQGFNSGDFISLLLKNKPIARALVAKTKDSIAGIKILKIYSQPEFDTMAINTEVQIVRGDDSAFFKTSKAGQEGEIGDQEIYDETSVVDQDLEEIDDKKDYLIMHSSIFSLGVGSVEGINLAAQPERYTQVEAQYMYQVKKNLFVSALYGQNTIANFPNYGLDTVLYNITIRVKYTFGIFWNLLLQPYFGYQFLIADSPGAGNDSSGTISQSQLDYETQLVNDLEDSGFIFGLSIFFRIVPGWYVQADLGTDMANIGFSLEI